MWLKFSKDLVETNTTAPHNRLQIDQRLRTNGGLQCDGILKRINMDSTTIAMLRLEVQREKRRDRESSMKVRELEKIIDSMKKDAAAISHTTAELKSENLLLQGKLSGVSDLGKARQILQRKDLNAMSDVRSKAASKNSPPSVSMATVSKAIHSHNSFKLTALVGAAR